MENKAQQRKAIQKNLVGLNETLRIRGTLTDIVNALNKTGAVTRMTPFAIEPAPENYTKYSDLSRE